ncbi:MAG: hypothetical protein ACWGSQ_11735 [Longimicrobiales bacterium]
MSARRLSGMAAALVTGGSLLFGGCDTPQPGEVLSVDAVGSVAGQLLFDANGNGGADQADRPLRGWTFNLNQPAGGTVASGVTDSAGVALFEEVPVGRLVPALSETQLGDTLSPIASTFPTFTLAAGDEVGVVSVVTLPSYSVADARDLPPEKPVFVEGVALNGFPTSTERNLHLRNGESFIRVLSVDSGFVSIGDTVRVRGRTARSQGVPVLDGKAVYRLGSTSPTPTAVTLLTGEAADARGGALDAALVAVFDAEILEVRDERNEGVRMVVDDGSGPVTIHFRAFLNVDPDAIDPDTDHLLRATGLLVPAQTGGGVAWEVQPRTIQEVVVVRLGN